MATEKPRFSLTVTPEMYEFINTYQHEHRLSTQTKAITQILGKGIDVLTERYVPRQAAALDEGTDLGAELSQIVCIYHSLNEEGQAVLSITAESLACNPKYKKNPSVQTEGLG